MVKFPPKKCNFRCCHSVQPTSIEKLNSDVRIYADKALKSDLRPVIGPHGAGRSGPISFDSIRLLLFFASKHPPPVGMPRFIQQCRYFQFDERRTIIFDERWTLFRNMAQHYLQYLHVILTLFEPCSKLWTLFKIRTLLKFGTLLKFWYHTQMDVYTSFGCIQCIHIKNGCIGMNSCKNDCIGCLATPQRSSHF